MVLFFIFYSFKFFRSEYLFIFIKTLPKTLRPTNVVLANVFLKNNMDFSFTNSFVKKKFIITFFKHLQILYDIIIRSLYFKNQHSMRSIVTIIENI